MSDRSHIVWARFRSQNPIRNSPPPIFLSQTQHTTTLPVRLSRRRSTSEHVACHRTPGGHGGAAGLGPGPVAGEARPPLLRRLLPAPRSTRRCRRSRRTGRSSPPAPRSTWRRRRPRHPPRLSSSTWPRPPTEAAAACRQSCSLEPPHKLFFFEIYFIITMAAQIL